MTALVLFGVVLFLIGVVLAKDAKITELKQQVRQLQSHAKIVKEDIHAALAKGYHNDKTNRN